METHLLTSDADLERFWAKVIRLGPDECWFWTDAPNHNGYGRFRVGSRKFRPHRIAWSLAHDGEDPGKRVVRHTCDTRLCCNAAHLVIGTQADNIADMVERGRVQRWKSKIKKCPQGHPYSKENTYWHNKSRRCRICNRDRARAAYRRKREQSNG